MQYKLLARSGLGVSEIRLGTMTFGGDWGGGTSKRAATMPGRASDRNPAIAAEVQKVAARHGVTSAQVALGRLRRQPGVSAAPLV